jgi:hypothetical protein
MTLANLACGTLGREEQILRLFFDASRAGDSIMLAKVATVRLNPVTDGTVRDFVVTDTGDETLEADTVRKSVTVRAELHTPRGEMVPRTLIFTFQRSSGGKGRDDVRHWMITGMH